MRIGRWRELDTTTAASQPGEDHTFTIADLRSDGSIASGMFNVGGVSVADFGHPLHRQRPLSLLGVGDPSHKLLDDGLSVPGAPNFN